MTVPRHLSLIYRLQDDVFSLQPRALVMLISTDDLGERALPVQIAANPYMLHGRISMKENEAMRELATQASKNERPSQPLLRMPGFRSPLGVRQGRPQKGIKIPVRFLSKIVPQRLFGDVVPGDLWNLPSG